MRKDGRARRLLEIELGWRGGALSAVHGRRRWRDVEEGLSDVSSGGVGLSERGAGNEKRCRGTCKSFGLCVAAWCSQSLLGEKKRTKPRIPTWSPTVVLTRPEDA